MTPEEQVEIDESAAALIADGFNEVQEFTYRGRTLRVGMRVSHCGQRYVEAYRNGTATLVRIFHEPNGQWEKDWGRPNVEVLALEDKARFGSRIGKWADYHCSIPECEESA